MTLSEIKKVKKDRGFTIVELLIVIVIIAILAAITIVAYNGIQARANTSAAQQAANTMLKKIEAYNAIKSTYPKSSTTFVTDMASDSTSTLTGTGITIGLGSTQPTSKSQLKVEICGTTGTGAIISYWDYTVNAATTTTANASGNKSLELGNSTGCTTAVTG
jgi:prepilin-type N-terminal cleavage/methylation domain-containing protein